MEVFFMLHHLFLVNKSNTEMICQQTQKSGASMRKRLGASMRMLGASMRMLGACLWNGWVHSMRMLGASMRMLGACLWSGWVHLCGCWVHLWGVGSFPKPPSGPRPWPRPPGPPPHPPPWFPPSPNQTGPAHDPWRPIGANSDQIQ